MILMAHDLRIGCVWLHGCYVQAARGRAMEQKMPFESTIFTAVSHQLSDRGANVFALKPSPA